MENATTRSTIYFDSDTHRALRMKAAATGRTVSDLVNEAVLASLRDDHADIESFSVRLAEPVMTYPELLAGLKADGKI